MKIYLVYGLLICTLFAVAGTRGVVVSSFTQPGGRAGGGGFFGHSYHHK